MKKTGQITLTDQVGICSQISYIKLLKILGKKNNLVTCINICLCQSGVLCYCGSTEFAPGVWAGIELDEAAGKNDGTVAGISYFKCSPKYGQYHSHYHHFWLQFPGVLNFLSTIQKVHFYND